MPKFQCLISQCGNFVENTVFPKFLENRPKLCGNCGFLQNFHTRKLSAITVIYAVNIQLINSVFYIRQFNCLTKKLFMDETLLIINRITNKSTLFIYIFLMFNQFYMMGTLVVKELIMVTTYRKPFARLSLLTDKRRNHNKTFNIQTMKYIETN